jgi:hypothetical protein
MADVITCPSGLTGRVRGMKVREERVLADRKLAKSGGQVDELAESQVVRLVRPRYPPWLGRRRRTALDAHRPAHRRRRDPHPRRQRRAGADRRPGRAVHRRSVRVGRVST